MNQDQTPETITFKRKTYQVVQEHGIPPLLAAEGLTRQATVQGPHGATWLLQTWNTQHGTVNKLISQSGRVEAELAK